MRLAPILAATALTLTACGGGSSTSSPAPTVTVTAPTTASSTAPASVQTTTTGEPSACLVAGSKWVDRMSSHVIDAATTAPGLAETLNLKDTNDPTSTITALCSDDIVNLVTKANAKMALVNFKLGLCALNPQQSQFGATCPKPLAKRVRAIANEVAPLVGSVRQRVG